MVFVPLEPISDTPEQLDDLVEKLEGAISLKKGRCKKQTFTSKSNDPIHSWKFNEWDYGKPKIKLPCNARGLFTTPDNKIAVRGYDKFFNVNEIELTKYESLKNLLVEDFSITLKENGCIIFISGLANGDIIVCSKHSTGVRDDVNRNHATQGEIEIEKQLSKIGMTTNEFGKFLYNYNITAVAELCDDSFEEHVLEYSRSNSGLYLHGINFNTIKFKTYPMEKVTEFAKEFGFKSVDHFNIEKFDDLWKVLNDSAKLGTYNNREIEGFVIRSKTINDEDFFFKFKFEEPYLLYRQFREVTKKYINNNNNDILSIVRSVKKHKYITAKYLEFVDKLFKDQPKLKEEYLEGYGIIKIRKLFLKENGLDELNGMKLIKIDQEQQQEDELNNLESKFSQINLDSITEYKYVLVPISTIGCGKTTTFQTLINLFPNWAHIQNDNIESGNKLKFFISCLEELSKPDCRVLFFDRNNHQYRERQQIFSIFNEKSVNYLPSNIGLKFIAVNFVPDNADDKTHWKVTHDRIVERGDNHQSIKSATNENLANSIMKGFIKRFQPLNIEREPDSAFDEVINLEISENSSLTNAKLILNFLHKIDPNILNRSLPSDEDYDQSFKLALNYKPSFTKFKVTASESKKAIPRPQYYGISIDDHSQLINIIDSLIATNETWIKIKESNRVQEKFHITLSHNLTNKGNPKAKESWNNLSKVLAVPTGKSIEKLTTYPVDFYSDVKINKLIVANDKLVTFEVMLLESYNSSFDKLEKFPYTNKNLHITIGTTTPEIKPALSNSYIDEIYNKDDDAKDGIYQINKELTIEVFSLKDEVVLEKQRCFIQY